MPKREITCKHSLPISRCDECYPIFLEETTVGGYQANPLNLNNDTISQNLIGSLLINALNYNSAVIEYASLIYNKAGLDPKSQEIAVKRFNQLHDGYNQTVLKILGEYGEI